MLSDDYPSLLWITLPVAIAISAFFGRKWYLAHRLQKHGIGKGAPGFQTSVRKIRVTPEIAARIRRGEEVSPEEIAAASAEAERQEEEGVSKNIPATKNNQSLAQTTSDTNEWLPEHLSTTKKRAKGKKK